jgi:hypothetical protein
MLIVSLFEIIKFFIKLSHSPGMPIMIPFHENLRFVSPILY